MPNGFPGSSAGKESTYNAGEPGLIPGSGRLAGEGIGYPLQYSWACLVAQLGKNLPAMWETWIWSLGWEDPLENATGYPLQYSGLGNSMDCIICGITKNRTWLSNFQCNRDMKRWNWHLDLYFSNTVPMNMTNTL